MSRRTTWMAAGMAALFGAGTAFAQTDGGVGDTGAIDAAKSSADAGSTAGETGKTGTARHKKTKKVKKRSHGGSMSDGGTSAEPKAGGGR